MSTVARKPAILSMVRRFDVRGHLKSGEPEADIHRMAAHELPAFDPAIIERYVENTYRKATAVFLGSVVAGVMIGAVFGALPLTSLGSSWPIPRMFGFATMLVGAIIGGVIGYLIGDTRAFLARLQGQTALAQIEAAKDARHALEAIQQIQALATRRVATSARPQHQAEPAVQPPVPTPAPVAPLVPPVTPAPAPLEAAPPLVEAAPAPVEVPPALVEAAPAPVEPAPPPPAPPALVIASAAPDIAPPLTPPLSS